MNCRGFNRDIWGTWDFCGLWCKVQHSPCSLGQIEIFEELYQKGHPHFPATVMKWIDQKCYMLHFCQIEAAGSLIVWIYGTEHFDKGRLCTVMNWITMKKLVIDKNVFNC